MASPLIHPTKLSTRLGPLPCLPNLKGMSGAKEVPVYSTVSGLSRPDNEVTQERLPPPTVQVMVWREGKGEGEGKREREREREGEREGEAMSYTP